MAFGFLVARPGQLGTLLSFFGARCDRRIPRRIRPLLPTPPRRDSGAAGRRSVWRVHPDRPSRRGRRHGLVADPSWPCSCSPECSAPCWARWRLTRDCGSRESAPGDGSFSSTAITSAVVSPLGQVARRRGGEYLSNSRRRARASSSGLASGRARRTVRSAIRTAHGGSRSGSAPSPRAPAPRRACRASSFSSPNQISISRGSPLTPRWWSGSSSSPRRASSSTLQLNRPRGRLRNAAIG